MNILEKRKAELYAYSAERTAADDFELFWERTLGASRNKPLNGKREEADTLSLYMTAYQITYEGYDHTPIHGWYVLPKFMDAAKLPCVVIYHGYHGSKRYPESYADWLLMGYAVFAVDVRGQGGDTGNELSHSFGMTKGWITQGILHPEKSYYQAITVDAIKAVEWVFQQPEIDKGRIYVAGASQGGGLSLLVSALSDIPAKTIADIPNMCHMDFGILHSTGSLTEAAAFISAYPEYESQVMRTLSYFDVLNLTDRLRKPVLMSVGLKDPICMPEAVFAVYNQILVPKEMHVYPFNGHYTTGDHFRKQIEFLRKSIN